MGTARLPDLIDGDELSAGWLNGLRDLLLSCRLTLDPASGISGVVGRSGTALHMAAPPVDPAPELMWVRITRRLAYSYSWIEQLPRPGGTWTNGTRSGTISYMDNGGTSGYEANRANTVPVDYIVRGTLYPGVGGTGELRFSSPACP